MNRNHPGTTHLLSYRTPVVTTPPKVQTAEQLVPFAIVDGVAFLCLLPNPRQRPAHVFPNIAQRRRLERQAAPGAPGCLEFYPKNLESWQMLTVYGTFGRPGEAHAAGRQSVGAGSQPWSAGVAASQKTWFLKPVSLSQLPA